VYRYQVKRITEFEVFFQQQVPHFKFCVHCIHVLLGDFFDLYPERVRPHPELVELGANLFKQLDKEACCFHNVEVEYEYVEFIVLVKFGFKCVDQLVGMS
jgi:hypothetical protein